jgi:predicted house-cleaning NTP pyrophosphatase (Maf/HAM1 superfamily)
MSSPQLHSTTLCFSNPRIGAASPKLVELILGSSSKFRRRILSQLVPCESDVASPRVVITFASPEIDEKAFAISERECNLPQELTLKIAHAKADALVTSLQRYESVKSENPRFLITSDQVTTWNGQIREKPSSVTVQTHLLFVLPLKRIPLWQALTKLTLRVFDRNANNF